MDKYEVRLAELTTILNNESLTEDQLSKYTLELDLIIEQILRDYIEFADQDVA